MPTKKELTETEICDQFITPAIYKAGWVAGAQVRREYSFTAGRVYVRGKAVVRGDQLRADYLLQLRDNQPIAVVEAKDNKHPVGGGMQQAIAYAKALDVPFVFSSNGDGFVFHDLTGQSSPVEVELSLDAFPSPDELTRRYRAWKGFSVEGEKVANFPYHEDDSGREPRYYQRIAIQRTVEAVVRGDRRILLVMATGTGKTYTAFQIMWRLWKAGTVKRVLFLADRNALVDQSRKNDFKPFGSVMTKVENRKVDKAYEVYLALYQAVTGTEEDKQIYRQFSPDFFDLVVVDEAHRGSAAEDSSWREILEWFKPAIQLGLTATPKETTDVSTRTYFGEPVYTYSLKQGIEDGFLAPYKVVRIDIDKDLVGWRPPKGMKDDLGQLIEDRVYNQVDMDKVLVLNQRTKLVAFKVVQYLLATDPYGKTIVFCENIDHATRMRTALINEVAKRMPHEKANLTQFVVRITGDDTDSESLTEKLIDPKLRFPVIATTSKLLTTGVDAQTCKLIVIDQRIQSMIEFKQIIGRGTRIREDAGKLWFTIMDFKKATELFADKAFDGEPVVVYEPDTGGPPLPPGGEGEDGDAPDDPPPVEPGEPPSKYVISNVPVRVVSERVQYYGKDGLLITESLKDYTRAAVRSHYDSLDDFLLRWSKADKKAALIEELRGQGVLFEELREQVGKDLDPFDLLCHVVYDRPPLTRRERAENVRKRDVFTRLGPAARKVLDALLDKYADTGVLPDDMGVLRVQPIAALGTPVEIVQLFGGRAAYEAAVHQVEAALYESVG